MKKFEIGQQVRSVINQNADAVIIEKEYYDEHSDEWFFGVTYKNEFRFVSQNCLEYQLGHNHIGHNHIGQTQHNTLGG